MNSSLRFAEELLIGYTAVLAKLTILWSRRRIAHRKQIIMVIWITLFGSCLLLCWLFCLASMTYAD